MILKIYFSLFILSFILLAIAYFSNPNIDILKIVGYGFIFMLGVMLIDTSFFGSVEICEKKLTFTEELYIYGDDYEGYHYDDYNATLHAGTLELFHKNITNTYTDICSDYDNQTFGFYIAIVGFLGWISVFLQIRNKREVL